MNALGPRQMALLACTRWGTPPVDAVFFDVVVIFCEGFFACILHGSASLKTSPPGRKRVWAEITLFDEYKGT